MSARAKNDSMCRHFPQRATFPSSLGWLRAILARMRAIPRERGRRSKGIARMRIGGSIRIPFIHFFFFLRRNGRSAFSRFTARSDIDTFSAIRRTGLIFEGQSFETVETTLSRSRTMVKAIIGSSARCGHRSRPLWLAFVG